MPQTTINIRMDADLKQKFEALCQNLGMNLTTAFTIYAKKAVRENAIPFALSILPDDPFYSKANMDELRRRANDPNPRFIVKTMEELEAMANE